MTDQLQERQSEPSSFRHEGFHLGKRLTEYFSVVTAASFALSIVANQAVFDGWGLNFLQLATFADVVMSGLSLLLFTVPLAAALLAAWLVGGLRGRLAWLRRVALGIAGFVFVLGLWGLVRGQGEEGAAAAVSSGGIVLVGLLAKPALRFRRRRTLGAGMTAAVASLLAALTLFQTIAYTVQKYQIGGYSSRAQLYLTPGVADCAGRALWTGERAVVLDCQDRGGAQDIRVIFGQESGLYRAVRPRQPG